MSSTSVGTGVTETTTAFSFLNLLVKNTASAIVSSVSMLYNAGRIIPSALVCSLPSADIEPGYNVYTGEYK
jgi:hypothetical protein